MADLTIRIIGDAAKLHSELSKASKDIDGFAGRTSARSKVIHGAITGGVLAAVGALGVSAVKAALEGEKAHALLVNAVTSTGMAFKAFAPEVEDTSNRLAKFGFENDEVENSLAMLTRATKSPSLGLRLMGLAADLARGRHIKLSEATAILTKVETGHVALLGRLGIQTKDATGKTISQEEAIRRLSAMYGGAAQANANTFAGRMQAVSAETKNLEEKIGTFLIPVLNKMLSIGLSVIAWLSKHKQVALALGIAVGTVLVAAIVAYTASMVSAAVATIAATWPILAVVAAVALLVLGVIYLYNHWDTIWKAIKNSPAYPYIAVQIAIIKGIIEAVMVVISWLRDNWPGIWNTIKEAAKTAASAIMTALGPVKSFIDGLTGAAQGLADALGKIPGIGGGHKVAPGPAPGGAPPGGVTFAAARSGESGRFRAAATVPSRGAGGGGVSVNFAPVVNGAVSPENTVLAIRQWINTNGPQELQTAMGM